MARQETIKILRSEVPSATPSLTAGEVAVNIADRRFFVGGTGGTSDRVTFRDERSTVWEINGLTGSVIFGVGQLSDVNLEDPPELGQYLQWNGIDEWRPGFAVQSINNQVGNLSLTGDGSSLIGRDNNKFTNRLATAGVTGVASFDPNIFTVSGTGHVSISTTTAIPVNFRDSYGTTINPKWGNTLTLTGGSGIEVQNTASNVLSFRGITATSSTLGVASFNPTYFSVASGAVGLATAYQATGDSVQAGSGIAISANKTITNIGVTGVGFGSDVGLTGKVNITAGSNITITQSGNLITFSGVAQQVTAVTGDGGAIVGKDNSNITARLATSGVTGVASFNSTYFSVASGAVSLATAYQATGDSVQAGHGIAISANKTIFNIGVTGFNGLTGNITVTGDGGSLVGKDNNRFTNRLADASATGVASFNSSYFSVASGAVSLAAAYQATGDTVITTAGSGIAISTSGKTDTLFNIGVTGFNGLTGNITVTGDGGSLVGKDNNRFTNRLADASATGVASFNSSYFTVSGGAVSLAAAYQATGDTVITTAGSGIAISTSGRTNTLFNIGVTGFNGLTGNITVTGDGGAVFNTQNVKTNLIGTRLATSSLTGVASFDPNDFTVSAAGQVAMSTSAAVPVVFRDSYGTTISPKWGSTVTLTGGSGIEVQNTASNLLSFRGITATSSTLGVASFNPTYFSVASGAVSLASAYQATGDTVITTAGSGIAISTSGKTDTLFNIGVTGFNGLTGNITVTGDGGSLVGAVNNKFTNRLATTGVTGVASFNSSFFSVSSGAVSLAAAYQATGDTVITTAGSGIAISANKTITNIGVTAFNGLTGIVSLTGCGGAVRGSDNSCITVRNASTTLTGVASFNSSYFSVSSGAVSLATAYQATGDSVQAGSGIAISANKTITNIGVTGFNGLTGNITVTGDGGSLVGAVNNRFTNRLASTSLTGVSYFDPSAFLVNADGLVQLRGGGTPPCSNYTNQADCVANGCYWCQQTGQCSAVNACGLFNALYSGMGISSDSQGALTFLYFDIGNLSAAGSGTTILSSDSVLFYDASETGLIKTKRATISKLILDNDNLFTVPSKSSNQLSATRGSSSIEFDVVLGRIAANDQGLIKGATAFAYIEQNTVRTINGLTGALQVVGSINGCSGNSLTITGTVNEVDVTNSCPTITIGLPNNVTIPHISGTGATFTGNVSANHFIGTVDGGTF